MNQEKIDWEVFKSEELIDFFGQKINVGDQLVKAEIYCSAAILVRRLVTKIENNRIYLDNSKIAIKFPRRCINISELRSGR